MLHIGFVLFSLSRQAGGLYDSARSLATHLNNLPDISVTVYGGEDEDTLEDLPGWGECRVNSFSTFGPKALRYMPDLQSALMKDNLDLIHQHGLWTAASRSVLNWHRKTGKPTVISPHGMLDAWALNHSSWKKRVAAAAWESSNLKSANLLHALCDSEANAISSYGLSQRTVTIPNGVKLPDESAPSKGKMKTLLYLGRLHEKKGLAPLIRAWNSLSPTNWRLRIVGTGEASYEARLKDLASGGPNPIEFPGPLYGPDRDEAYRSADAFILPSFSEGFPMVVLEAMSFQLPVIMTEFCNFPSAFENGAALKTGTNENDIEAALGTFFLLGNDQHERMGTAGFKLVSQQYQWPIITQQFAESYRLLT